MKRILLFSVYMGTALLAFAQHKNIDPLFGAELNRMVSFAQVENSTFCNVLVEVKSGKMGASVRRGVKVTVWDSKSETELFEKRFPKSFLYLLPDGTIQIGEGDNSTQVVLFKSDKYRGWMMKINSNDLLHKE